MTYLITKINDEDVIIGELTAYSMFSGAPGTENNKDIIREIRFTYEHKKVKEWVDKTESIPFITICSDGRTINTFSKCTREINEEGYATYSYKILWPGYNTPQFQNQVIHDYLTELITQFKRDQKIEDILE
jgi:hypothetical protein